ncbi:MAG: DNA translocase FtsK 4TM domain-containing protein, partial [Methyloceanibacter sp.]
MARGRTKERRRLLPDAVELGLRRLMFGAYGLGILTVACAAWISLATWSVHDPSLNNATHIAARNVLGEYGAMVADLAIQSLGLASIVFFLPLAAWGWHLVFQTMPNRRKFRLLAWPAAVLLLAAAMSALPQPKSWPLPNGLGGILGDFFMAGAHIIGPFLPDAAVSFVAGLVFLVFGTMLLLFACGTSTSRLLALWAPRSSAAGDWANAWLGGIMHFVMHSGAKLGRLFRRKHDPRDESEAYDDEDGEEQVEEERALYADGRIEPSFGAAPVDLDGDDEDDVTAGYRITRTEQKPKKRHTGLGRAPRLDTPYDPPSFRFLQQARSPRGRGVSDEVLQENARELEGVLQDFGVKGEITNVRPGPVVTLYELEPAPGTKSSRVIGLADDIARSMSAVSTRVAVVPGRNAIGIELPNDQREMVMLREL